MAGRRSALGASLLALVGCTTQDSGGEITSSQSAVIWSSAYAVVVAAQDQFLPELRQRDSGSGKGDILPDGGADTDGATDVANDGGPPPGDGAAGGWVSGTISSFQITGTVTNPNGSGSATVSGSGGKQGSTWGVTLTVTFTNWDTGAGIVINGPLSVTYSLTSLIPAAMTLEVGGTLTATIAKIPLPAVVIVKVEVANGQTTVCGSVAGNEVGSGPCP